MRTVHIDEATELVAATAVTGKADTHRPSPHRSCVHRSCVHPSCVHRTRTPRRLSVVAAALTLSGLAAGRFFSTPSIDTSPSRTRAPASIIAVTSDEIPTLEAHLTRDPSDLRALQQLGVAYVRRAAFGDPMFYELADRALVRAESLAPNDPITMIARASYLLSLHQFDRARALGLAVHQRFPDINDANAVLVDASVELGRYDDAQQYLQTLVDRRAALPSYARVSYLRELHGDLDGAASAMQLAINAGRVGSADHAAVTSLLGDIEFNLGRYAPAEAAYTSALREAPVLPLATLGLARVEASTGRIPQAIERLQTLTQQYPLPAAIVLLGDLQQRVGDAAHAKESFALVDAIATVQQRAGQVVDLEMAQFALDHQRVAQGVGLAESAYAARPSNVYVSDVLAWARFRQGRFVEAQSLSSSALRLGSSEATLQFHRAAIEFALGNRSQAKQHLSLSFKHSRYGNFAEIAERDVLAHQLGVDAPMYAGQLNALPNRPNDGPAPYTSRSHAGNTIQSGGRRAHS